MLVSFPFVPPPTSHLAGAYFLLPLDSRAIFVHNDLLRNDTCCVIRGAKRTWGGGKNGKNPNNFFHLCPPYVMHSHLRSHVTITLISRVSTLDFVTQFDVPCFKIRVVSVCLN